MTCSKFDLFSSQFFFNIGSQHIKKGTILGIVLSFVVLITSATYLIYILYQYATNQLDPTFRTQKIISNQTIDMQLSNDLVGFRFDYDSNLSIESLQAKNNKTYIVYIAQFHQSNRDGRQSFLLDIIDCKNPSLKDFKCIDFSRVSNYSLSLNTDESLLSQINIFTYSCLDQDSIKTVVPNNCASQKEIDTLVNGINAVMRLKLYTSQFNTTTQETQVNYRNAYIYTVASQLILSRMKTQKQISTVKTGLIIQSDMSFSSPIEYYQYDQSFDRLYSSQSIGLSFYSQVMLYPDEIVQQVKIQYPTLPQVFAQVNSIFTLLMLLGIIGRSVSNSSIKKDFIMLFLKNIYQSNYLQMLGLQQSTSIQNQVPQQSQEQSSLQNYIKPTTQQQQEVKYQKEEAVEITKEIEDFCEVEEIFAKNGDEINEQQPIPLFSYRPSFQSERFQQKNKNKLNNNLFFKQSSLILENKVVKDQIFQKKQNKIQEFSLQNAKESSFQKSNFEDKQMLSMVSDSIFSLKNQNCGQKSIFRDSYLSYSQSQNLNDNKDNKQNKNYYKQCLINQIKKKDENVNECVKKLQAIHNKDSSSKIFNLMFKFKQIIHNYSNLINFNLFLRFCKKRLKSDEIDVLNKSQQQKIENHINQDLDILNFFNDMIFLKKAVMLLLRKDQLAALKLVGFTKSILDLDLKNIDAKSESKSKQFQFKQINNQYLQIQLEKELSYYEMQYAILQSEQLQQYQLEKFLQRCKNNYKITQIDNRILQSFKANQLL